MKRLIICLLTAFVSGVAVAYGGGAAVEAETVGSAAGEVGNDSAGAAASAVEVENAATQRAQSQAAGNVAVAALVEDAADAVVAVDRKAATAMWNEANEAYHTGDFAAAAALYDKIEAGGLVGAKLYYNKAGALFKMGKVGESILYYSKAQRLAPYDGDIDHNLAIVGTYTRNRIEPVPEFFVRRWMRGLSSMMGGDGWALLSVGLFALALAGVLVYLLPLARRVRRVGFWSGVGATVLFAFAFSFASRDYYATKHPASGIVMSVSAAAKSSPDESGKDLFLLYEGDRVEILDALGDWSEIEVANGSRGWIRTGAFRVID
ncbi:MAG: SH3 domain-containing protein [Alistipes sp.]|jgi:tetratricopeptide (TPR) repeat protein|nr:SH3 domain-containing protein [Alistipes sp.]